MKLSLEKVQELEQELNILSRLSLPFSLKYKIETKLKPDISAAVKLISEKTTELALSHGAIADQMCGWKFELDAGGVVKDLNKFMEYRSALSEYLTKPENEIEINVKFKLSLFSDIKDASYLPVMYLLIEDDTE